jgi:hypothetical protein
VPFSADLTIRWNLRLVNVSVNNGSSEQTAEALRGFVQTLEDKGRRGETGRSFTKLKEIIFLKSTLERIQMTAG